MGGLPPQLPKLGGGLWAACPPSCPAGSLLKKANLLPPQKASSLYSVGTKCRSIFASRGGCVGKELGGALFCMQNRVDMRRPIQTIYPCRPTLLDIEKIRNQKTCPNIWAALGGLPSNLPKLWRCFGRPAPQAAQISGGLWVACPPSCPAAGQATIPKNMGWRSLSCLQTWAGLGRTRRSCRRPAPQAAQTWGGCGRPAPSAAQTWGAYGRPAPQPARPAPQPARPAPQPAQQLGSHHPKKIWDGGA